MNEFNNIKLSDWQRRAGGWFKYNSFDTNQMLFSIELYHDKVEKLTAQLSANTKKIYSSLESHNWFPHFSYSAEYLNDIFHKTYGRKIVGTEVEAKNIIDKFLIKMNGLLVFI